MEEYFSRLRKKTQLEAMYPCSQQVVVDIAFVFDP